MEKIKKILDNFFDYFYNLDGNIKIVLYVLACLLILFLFIKTFVKTSKKEEEEIPEKRKESLSDMLRQINTNQKNSSINIVHNNPIPNNDLTNALGINTISKEEKPITNVQAKINIEINLNQEEENNSKDPKLDINPIYMEENIREESFIDKDKDIELNNTNKFSQNTEPIENSINTGFTDFNAFSQFLNGSEEKLYSSQNTEENILEDKTIDSHNLNSKLQNNIDTMLNNQDNFNLNIINQNISNNSNTNLNSFNNYNMNNNQNEKKFSSEVNSESDSDTVNLKDYFKEFGEDSSIKKNPDNRHFSRIDDEDYVMSIFKKNK